VGFEVALNRDHADPKRRLLGCASAAGAVSLVNVQEPRP
jgi:hypothetical protein